MEFKSEKQLVDYYLDNNHLPYETVCSPSQLKIYREFEIVSSHGLRRFDLLIINDIEKRYDVIEFKNRELMLKDTYQVFGYIKSFLENQFKGVFNHEYQYCFHLIGKDYTDNRLDNILLLNSDILKIYVFYSNNNRLEIYEQDLFNVI
jgi:hypothetical protein